MPRKIASILLLLLTIHGDTSGIGFENVPALLAPQSRFARIQQQAFDVPQAVRDLCSVSTCIQAESFNMALPEGGLGENPEAFLELLAGDIKNGKLDNARRRLWVFKELFSEKAEVFSKPFIGADGRVYKLRLRANEDKAIEVVALNYENEVAIQRLKISIKKITGIDVTTEFLNNFTAFVSAGSIENGLKYHTDSITKALKAFRVSESLMSELDRMVSSGAGDFFEYAFANAPEVAVGAIVFNSIDGLQMRAKRTWDVSKDKGNSPASDVRANLIMKAAQADVNIGDFEGAKKIEKDYLSGKDFISDWGREAVETAGTARPERRLEQLRLIDEISKSRDALIKKWHKIEGLDLSVGRHLASLGFRRAFYEALYWAYKKQRGIHNPVEIQGFPGLWLSLKDGILSVLSTAELPMPEPASASDDLLSELFLSESP